LEFLLKLKTNKLNSKSIAKHYSLFHLGEIRNINDFGSLDKAKENKILWTKSEKLFLQVDKGILLAPNEFKNLQINKDVTYLFCNKSPRLIFAKVLNDFFKSAVLDDFTNCLREHKKNPNIKIGENSFIGENVKIGDGTEILHNTSIFSNTTIGKNCLINTNCSLSTPGLGFEYDGLEIIKFPQFGGVEIGDNVEIGPNSTIRRGALDNTVIGEGTKIGSLSNIGHNCIVGKQCILTCQIVLGGSTIIGDRVFMGINSSTKNKVIIGNDVTIGMGAVVIKSVQENSLAVGLPAKVYPKN